MQFKLIMVFAGEDKTDKVLTASREAGATGATIITNARGQGLKKSIGIFGLEILNYQDVILILAENRRANDILEAVSKAGNPDGAHGSGIALQIDVDEALGLAEHIKTL